MSIHYDTADLSLLLWICASSTQNVPNSQETEFVSNMVRTAKFEYYDFLPKFLWEEFNPATKIANVYFLFIAALQVSLRWLLTTER